MGTMSYLYLFPALLHSLKIICYAVKSLSDVLGMGLGGGQSLLTLGNLSIIVSASELLKALYNSAAIRANSELWKVQLLFLDLQSLRRRGPTVTQGCCKC